MSHCSETIIITIQGRSNTAASIYNNSRTKEFYRGRKITNHRQYSKNRMKASLQTISDPQKHLANENIHFFVERPWKLTKGMPNLCMSCTKSPGTRAFCTVSEHFICEACEKNIKKRHCTICNNAPFNEIVKNTLDQSLESLAKGSTTYQCMERDCHWQGNYVEAKTHPKNCPTQKYLCKYNQHGCHEQGPLNYLSEHQINCEYREKPCSNCNEPVSLKKLEEHDNTCPEKPLSRVITLKRRHWDHLDNGLSNQDKEGYSLPPDLAQVIKKAADKKQSVSNMCQNGCFFSAEDTIVLTKHYQEDCPLQATDCNYKSKGCNFRAKRFALAKHVEECLYGPAICPRQCGDLALLKHELQDGKHDKVCPKLLINCQFCGHIEKRQDIALHERSCQQRIVSCLFCHKKMRQRESDHHRDNCPEDQPFTYAGTKYRRQPGTTAKVYQPAEGNHNPHILIKVKKQEIVDFLEKGQPTALINSCGLSEDSPSLQFTLCINYTSHQFNLIFESAYTPDYHLVPVIKGLSPYNIYTGLYLIIWSSQTQTQLGNICSYPSFGKKNICLIKNEHHVEHRVQLRTYKFGVEWDKIKDCATVFLTIGIHPPETLFS